MNAIHSQVIALNVQIELHVFIDFVESNQKSSNLSLTQVEVTWVHTSGLYAAFLALMAYGSAHIHTQFWHFLTMHYN